MPEEPRDPRAPPSRRGAVIGLFVALALIVLGVVLVRLLGQSTRLEDCGLSGRTNCAPIDTNGGSR
ncbi:MAG TPA: hypothetical protein VGH61_07145 [Steroidobacteraceae bacterium]